MRSASLLALALALASALLPQASRTAEIDDPAARTRLTTLDNGVRILTLEDHTTPTVSYQTWVHVGSGDEARWTGVAHLFEHMMFRGSKRVPGAVRDALLRARGSRGNAYTSSDVTVYFEDTAAEHLPLVIELEAERFQNLVISPEVLDTERQVVLEERRMRTEDNPRGRMIEALLSLTFTAHPYRTPTIGWQSDVEKVDVDTCLEFFHHYYVPNNVVISIAGDFDQDDAIARIRKHYAGWERGAEPPRNPTVEPPQDGERRAIVHVPVRAPLVGVAWHAPKSGSPDGPALDVLSEILSAGRTSRLQRKLVYEAQEALNAYGGYWELEHEGLFYAGVGVRPGKDPARSEELLFAEIERLRRTPPTAAELEKAKRVFEVDMLAGLGTANALAGRNAEELLTFGRIRTIRERLDAVRAVTAAEVQRVAELYLKPEQRSVVHVLPAPGPAPAEDAE
ncbi:MAG TPA: pitrilysin family protein [Myxococcota bacterium]|nr:pitrilysin family protein [Myxococcota bacterium]